MKPAQAGKAAASALVDPFETLSSQVAKPIMGDFVSELGSFFGGPKNLSRNPKALAQEDLQRARDKQKIDEMGQKDAKNSDENISKVSAAIQAQYRHYENKNSRNQQELKQEVSEFQSEIGKLAKAAGVETKTHLETMPKKVGVLDIKRLTAIARYLRMKAEDAKSAQDLLSQRQNAKRATGTLVWVSGKQMKIHEQGTLQLQG